MVSLRTKKAPLDANGNEILEDAAYIAIDSFCCGPHGEYVIARGARLRGRSEAVQTSSTLWLLDGATDDEVTVARRRLAPDTP